MSTITAESGIIQKTLELCQTILEQPEFQVTRRQIDSFMADEQAQTQYQLVMQKGDLLQHKQQMGLPLTNEEILEFEQQRDALVNNAVAQGFIAAQQHMPFPERDSTILSQSQKPSSFRPSPSDRA